MTKKHIILLGLLCTIGTAHTSPDCLDNSKYLAERYDSGEYYLVSEGPQGPCLCPCEKHVYNRLSCDRGKCSKCHHYRVPKPAAAPTANKPVIRKNIWENKSLINIPKLARAAQLKRQRG